MALSGLVIGRLHCCVRASRGFPNRKHLYSLELFSAAGKHFVAEFLGETLPWCLYNWPTVKLYDVNEGH